MTLTTGGGDWVSYYIVLPFGTVSCVNGYGLPSAVEYKPNRQFIIIAFYSKAANQSMNER